MNIEKLKSIFQAYREILPEAYSSENREYVKWSAAMHFHRCWDLHATDFASMFKAAISKSDMLINNRMVQPINGILRLANKPELTETIRSLFGMLFSDDGGDLQNRQYRIEQFCLQINMLLSEHESGKWKYKQDFRTVLAYLNLFRPGENYLLKSSQAYQFKYCVEYGDDFGYGSQFSLAKYYRMCNLVRDAIAEDNELTDLHRQYLAACQEQITDADLLGDQYHLLTFDVIYCTSVYRLYEKAGLSIRKPKRNEKVKVVEKSEIKNALREAIRADEMNYCELLEQRSRLDDFTAVGLQVSHALFGRGMITAQDQMRITVQFADKECMMLLPDAFTNKNIRTDDPEIPAIMQEICKLNRQIEKVTREIKDKQKKLAAYEQ